MAQLEILLFYTHIKIFRLLEVRKTKGIELKNKNN